MKYSISIKVLSILLLLSGKETFCQNPVNWTTDQLIQPSQLSSVLSSKKKRPVIFSVGPSATIPHSIDIGMVKDESNLKKFKEQLSHLSRKTKIVVYCGCCPYDHCPDVRPAMQTLKEMKFTNYKLLDLPHNIKVDWISKGYPVNN